MPETNQSIADSRLTSSFSPELAKGKHVVALSGGVGGAKLALGLARVLPADRLRIVANTADDFTHLGLRVCPDLDTVMYTLAGCSNTELGWGLAGETWQCMDAMARLGGENWFRLGDRDLATHLHRTALLADGKSLSQVTEMLCRAFGVKHRLSPMSDQPVATRVLSAGKDMSFQHYFVREKCQPVVEGFTFEGIESATPGEVFSESLLSPDLAAVVICPSNPFVSVAPILGVPGIREMLLAVGAPVVAVSPIIGRAAVKGPTAKMMAELGLECSAVTVANYYAELIDGFVLDTVDHAIALEIEALGVKVLVCDTLMNTLDDKIGLAQHVLAFADQLKG